MKAYAKRAVLFGIDGAGTFFEQTPTPNIDRIFKNGAVSRRTLTELPSISAECWGSMLHGVDCGRHGLTNWVAGHRPFPGDSPYPSVFRVIREQRPEAELASFCDWKNINIGIIEDEIGVYKINDRDYNLVEPAIDYINSHDFTLMYFQFDSVDHEGHAHGYGSPEHLEMITKNDGYVGRIVEAIEKRGWLEDTLIIVEADHGGTPADAYGRGEHGGDTDAEKYVCFYAVGGGARHVELHDMLSRDTAPAILHALGIEQPGSWNSRVPGGLFEDIPENLPRPEGLPLAARHTPSKPENGGFMAGFADLEPLVYLPFESLDALPEGTRRFGKFYNVEGVRGRALRMDDGGISIPCPSLKEGFSLTGWLKLNAEPDWAVVAGTRGYAGAAPGFCVYVRPGFLRAAFSTPQPKGHTLELALPKRFEGEWLFIAVVFDPAAERVGISLDFETLIWHPLGDRPAIPDGAGRLNLGMGPDFDASERLPGALDDICLCRKPLDDGDIARLRAYYLD